MNDDQVIAALYALASICVVYKLAYLIRQAAALPSFLVQPFRLVGVLVGTLIIYRVVSVTDGRSQAEPFDVTSQIAWCVVLYFAIVLLGRKKQVW